MKTPFELQVQTEAMFCLCDEGVTPRLRAFSIDVAESWRVLSCRFHFDGEPTEDEKEASAEIVGLLVSAHWQEIEKVNEEYLSCPAPQVPEHLKLRVFQRNEGPAFVWAR